MSVPFSNTKLRAPRGFSNVMWVLSREVIRDEPADIVTYSHDFMQKLLKIREETGHDPALHGAHSEDRFYNNFSFKELQKQSSQATIEVAEEPTPQVEQTETDATPATDAPPPSDNETETTQPAADDGKSGETTTAAAETEEEVDIDLNDPAVLGAATMIQASFRGHISRRRHSKDKK